MGRHFANQFTPSGFENALRCFQQVTQMDGADFRAFEGVSSTYLALGAFLARDPRSLWRGFIEAHERAVALRSFTPELRTDYAYALYIFRRDLAAAEAGLLEVRRERPASADVCVRLAMVYASLGRLAEALDFTKQAHAADELLAPLTFVETVIRLCRREFDLASRVRKNMPGASSRFPVWPGPLRRGAGAFGQIRRSPRAVSSRLCDRAGRFVDSRNKRENDGAERTNR